LATALARDDQHVRVEVDVVEGEADHLFTPGAGVG
jgi:hypothetical protein